MKWLVLPALFVASVASASGMRAVDGRRYTCDQLKKIVKKEKMVLIHNGAWGGRFVASKYDCPPYEKSFSNAYLAVKDTRWCSPGLWCRWKMGE